jgi:formate dehydrogenase subunit gamma
LRASIIGSRRCHSSWSQFPPSLFHPSLFFLTALFAGGEMTRIIHPWIGVALFFSFLGLFVRFWRLNLWRAQDGTWLARIRDVLANGEENLPEVGKYNAGQEFVFWGMSILIVLLITSAIVIWDQYFCDFTSIE